MAPIQLPALAGGRTKMMVVKPIFAAFVLLFALAAAGCGGAEAGPTLVRQRTWEGGVAALFQAACLACHNGPGGLGGWDAGTYQTALDSGDHAPVIVPGDPDAGPLVAKMRGTPGAGVMMPPAGLLAPDDVQLVVYWVQAGAPER